MVEVVEEVVEVVVVSAIPLCSVSYCLVRIADRLLRSLGGTQSYTMR